MKARLSLLKTIVLGSLAFSCTSYADVQQPIIESYAKHAQYLDIKISPEGTYLASTSRSEDGLISLTVLDIKKQEVLSITRGR
ncbi:MAG: S9 family peptidase, partial [Pseudomonadota bacterium]|nr:S9 family peptidase [Pseudomonadota bacterium]